MPGTEVGSSKGKGKAVKEPEKWDMAKGYKNLKDNKSNDEDNRVKKENPDPLQCNNQAHRLPTRESDQGTFSI
jgi:hypothetical protein